MIKRKRTKANKKHTNELNTSSFLLLIPTFSGSLAGGICAGLIGVRGVSVGARVTAVLLVPDLAVKK